MTTAEVVRRAVAAGLRFEIENDRVVVLGPDEVLDEMLGALRPHHLAIRALLEEHRSASSASELVEAASRLLRHGLWPPTKPAACRFYCGQPQHDECRRCHASWADHAERAAGRSPSKHRRPQRRP